MYRFIRSAAVKSAVDMPGALQFCNEVTSHINKTYNMSMKTGAQMFGNTRVYWFFDMNSLEEMAQLNAKLMQDRPYWEILAKAKDLWVEGSLKDTVVTMIG